MQQMLWMGAREMFQTLKCSTGSEEVIGPVTPAWPHRRINFHHHHPHHIQPPAPTTEQVMTGRSMFYNTTLMESGADGTRSGTGEK